MHNVGNGHLFSWHCTVDLPSKDTAYLTVKKFHDKLGHPVIQDTIRTSKCNNIKLDTTLTLEQTWEDCVTSKYRRVNLIPVSKNPATVKGERLSFDLSWIDELIYGGKEYWLHVIDEFTKYTWSFLLKEKVNWVKTW